MGVSHVSRRALLAGATGLTGALVLGAAPPASAAGRVALGAYCDGMDRQPQRLDALSSTLRQSLSIASVFRGAGDVWPGPTEARIAAGRTLLVSWYLDHRSYGYWTSPAARSELVTVARRVKAYGRPVAIRPWAEMNGDWQPWQPTSRPVDGYASGYGAFIAAWRHIVNLFRGEGVRNVKWVFNPTTDTYAGTTDVRRIWPGRDYVDVLGLDGYNWGTGGVFTWRSFESIYRTQYNRLVSLAPGMPLWICEVGCADPLSVHDGVKAPVGQSKGRWWLDAAAAVRRMPAVQAVVLFDVKKERDWRVQSSVPARASLVSALATLRTA